MGPRQQPARLTTTLLPPSPHSDQRVTRHPRPSPLAPCPQSGIRASHPAPAPPVLRLPSDLTASTGNLAGLAGAAAGGGAGGGGMHVGTPFPHHASLALTLTQLHSQREQREKAQQGEAAAGSHGPAPAAAAGGVSAHATAVQQLQRGVGVGMAAAALHRSPSSLLLQAGGAEPPAAATAFAAPGAVSFIRMTGGDGACRRMPVLLARACWVLEHGLLPAASHLLRCASTSTTLLPPPPQTADDESLTGPGSEDHLSGGSPNSTLGSGPAPQQQPGIAVYGSGVMGRPVAAGAGGAGSVTGPREVSVLPDSRGWRGGDRLGPLRMCSAEVVIRKSMGGKTLTQASSRAVTLTSILPPPLPQGDRKDVDKTWHQTRSLFAALEGIQDYLQQQEAERLAAEAAGLTTAPASEDGAAPSGGSGNNRPLPPGAFF